MRARVLSAVVAGAVLTLGPVPSAFAAPADAEVTAVCDPQLDRPEILDRAMDQKSDQRKDQKKRFDTNNMSVDSALALLCG